MSDWALVGDIGGTNARFGHVDLSGDPLRVQGAASYRVADFPSAAAAVAAHVAARRLPAPGAAALIAVAGPVADGAIEFTNSEWTLSEAELLGMGFGTARLINDYAALALAAPRLGPDDLRAIGGEQAGAANGAVAVLGPGTGFGAALLARDGRGAELPVAGEGGHIGFAPADETEIELLRRLSAIHGRVSVERILSGAGLGDLHAALLALDGREPTAADAAEITRLALAGDAPALRTMRRFCAILGSVAGDFALAYGATGGVFIAGGIAPRILGILEGSGFRERFEDKGRFAAYMARIPTRVVVRPHAALVGAAAALGGLSRRRST